MKSTRLPKKLTLQINGREIIRHMIDRLKESDVLDEIIICTSPNPQDQVLVQIAKEENIQYFLGDEDDVILRLYEASKKFNLDYALNITADCPLVSIEYVDKIVDAYKESKADFIRTLDLPHGFFSYGLKVDAMKKVCEMKKGTDTEVWGRYFTDTGLFKVVDIEIPPEFQRKDYRLTLDYPEDFEFFKKIYYHFGADTYKTSMYDIIKYLDDNPDVVKINAHCRGLYKERFKSQNKLEV
jgi:spore coat polysaccharide biosynthesis protein SpsF